MTPRPPTQAIVFAPAFDTQSKHDAAEFQSEGREFCRVNGLNCGVAQFDNQAKMQVRKGRVLRMLNQRTPVSIETIVFLCHGWPAGIQAGFRTDALDELELAVALKAVCTPNPTVVLYCCDAGRDADAQRDDDMLPGPGGSGGFADGLRNACGEHGVDATVFAHASLGHCTYNPYVRVFHPGETGGGRFLIGPDHALWSEWKAALRDTTIRYRFPFMSLGEIEAELTSARNVA